MLWENLVNFWRPAVDLRRLRGRDIRRGNAQNFPNGGNM